MQKAVSFNNVAFVFANGNYYRTHVLYKNQEKVINLFKKNAALTEKSEIL